MRVEWRCWILVAALLSLSNPAGAANYASLGITANPLWVRSLIGISASGSRGKSRFHNDAYRALMERECGVLVAENETKWQSLRPRPTTSGHTTRKPHRAISAARKSKSRAQRVSPCTQTSTRSLRGSPHSR